MVATVYRLQRTLQVNALGLRIILNGGNLLFDAAQIFLQLVDVFSLGMLNLFFEPGLLSFQGSIGFVLAPDLVDETVTLGKREVDVTDSLRNGYTVPRQTKPQFAMRLRMLRFRCVQEFLEQLILLQKFLNTPKTK